ncbi:MAG: DUF3883 domain-containing protein [Desulfuromonadales bacterium]
MSSYREHILQKTSGTIKTFLQALASGSNIYRSIHNLTEQVTHQYSGRFLVELLQNAHDVLPESPRPGVKSRIAIILEEPEEPFGALYVANDGQPFSPSNFNSLSALGNSDKNPEKSIGNKGIGFRSVLEITREPQIYSRFAEDSQSFDGYCFSFKPTVADVFCNPINELMHGNLRVKSPISDKELLVDWTENTLRDLMNRHGKKNDDWLRKELAYLSPYLLPLPLLAEKMTERTAALEKEGFSTVIRLPFMNDAARQLAIKKLAELNINTTLFLERVSLLQLETGTTKRAIRKVSQSLADSQNGKNLTLELMENNAVIESKRYLVWNEHIGGDSQPAVRDELSATVAHLPGTWKDMKSATVSLAVRIADEPESGYFNIYLPTEVPTGCCAHISAPFFGDMSRTHINFSDPYNSLLLGKAAAKAVKVVIESLAGKGADEGRAIIDILAPVAGDRHWYDRWKKAIPEKFAELPLCYSENGWSPLDETSLIPEAEGALVLTEDNWHRHATFSIFSSLLKSRYESIQRLYKAIGSDAIPAEVDILDTIEKIAEWLHTSETRPDWEGFWNDVINTPMWQGNRSVKRSADSLKGRRILPGNDGELHAPSKAHTLFFPPQKGFDEGAENLDSLNIPPAFQTSMAFLDESLAQHKTLRPFFATGLVQDFRVEDIFRLILLPGVPQLPLPLKSSEEGMCKDILMWAVKLVSGMLGRGKGKTSIAELMAKMPVPCNGGWFPACETSFGPGWDKTCGEDLSVYLNGADTKECRELLKRLVSNSFFCTGEHFREALVLAGVTNGFKGDMQTMSSLPGLERYDALDAPARMAFMRLVLVILQTPDVFPINSPLSSCLRKLRWLGCEKNGLTEWVSPEERWYIPRALLARREWQFAHLNILTANVTSHIASSTALEQNLEDLGMPRFDPENETDDPRLLNDLASALQSGTIADRNVFLGHIHDAWRLFRPAEQVEMPTQLIVTKGSAQLHIVTPSQEAPLFVPNASATCINALTQCGLPVIEMESDAAKKIAPVLKAHFGDTIRLASDLENWPVVGGKRWTHSEGERFADSGIGWLAPLMLTLFAFAGNKGSGCNTKTFTKAIQMVRDAHVCWSDNLEIGLWQEEQLVASHQVAAFWLDEQKTLICETGSISRYSVFSEALEALLGRSDLKRDLKFVLRELEQFDSPTQENICAAFADSLEIKPHQYYSVVEQWRGDISQLIHLLAPVVTLLKPDMKLDELGAITTEEELLLYVQQLQPDIETGELLKIVRASNDFDDLGKRLYEMAGEMFQLSAWNDALEKAGEKRIASSGVQSEFRQHLSQSFVPLRALLLDIFEREALPGSFAELSAGIDELELPAGCAERFWRLPFCETMRVVADHFNVWNSAEPEIEALINAESVDVLKQNLEAHRIDISHDPFEIQKLNRESVRTAVQAMQRFAIAWGVKTGAATTAWEAPFDLLFREVWEPVEQESLRAIWTPTECYTFLSKFPHDEAHREFWRLYDSAGDIESFADSLDLSEKELSSAEESLETGKEKKRRQSRMEMVCGKPFDSSDENIENLWGHIASALTPEMLADIEIPKIAVLKDLSARKTMQSAFDRELPKGKPKERISKPLEKLIGQTGETWAYHVFLPKMFGESSINSSCWISANSLHEYPDNIVDDGFGCDFKIHANDKTYYIEVKATKGSDETFQMGVSEVRLAEDVISNRSRRKHEEFLVLHISGALGVLPQPRFLHNPYHPKFRGAYQIENAGVWVRFRVE